MAKAKAKKKTRGKYDVVLNNSYDFADYLLDGIFEAQELFRRYRAYGSDGSELLDICQEQIEDILETLADAYSNVCYCADCTKKHESIFD